MLPIELICDVTGIPIWIINDTLYLPANLFSGEVAGHNSSGTDILVNSPVNNTKYVVCLRQLMVIYIVIQLTLLLLVSLINIEYDCMRVYVVCRWRL